MRATAARWFAPEGELHLAFSQHCVRLRQIAVMKFFVTFALGVCAASAHAAQTKCAPDCAYEPEPFLQAPALVQTSLLNGPNFRVVPEVQVRGYMARFLIDTRFGP